MKRLENFDIEYFSAYIDFEGQFVYKLELDEHQPALSFPVSGTAIYLYIHKLRAEYSWESYTESYRYGKPKRKPQYDDYVYCLGRGCGIWKSLTSTLKK